MKTYLKILAFFIALTVSLSAGIIVNGTSDLDGELQDYVQAMTIRHSGSMMNSLEQLEFIKTKIANNEEPWATYYTRLTSPGHSKLTWVPHASATPTAETALIGDAYAAYNQALIYYFTGNTAYAENARTIINAWSSTVQSWSGITNWYLAPAWSASIMAPAAELLRNTYPGWTATDTAQCTAMFDRAFLPVLKFRYAYGNRELSVCNALVAIGVFNDDKAALYMGLYHWVSYVPCFYYLAVDGATPIRADYFSTEPAAADYYLMHTDRFPTQGAANDWLYIHSTTYPNRPYTGKSDDGTIMLLPNGSGYTPADQWYMGPTWLKSIPNPVPAYVEGQSQETFRDLGHVEFAFAATINTAEIAWNQGIDLYSGHATRLTKFMELHAGFRLNESLPAALAGSGVLNPGDGMAATVEIAYNRFHDNLGISLPKTLQLLSTIRTELWYRTGITTWTMGQFGTGNSHAGTWSECGLLTAPASMASTWQAVTVPVNTNQVASLWLKGTGSVQVLVKGGTLGATLASIRCDATSTWQQFTTPVFNTGDYKQVTLQIVDAYGIAGTIYLDDLFLGGAGDTNLLGNPTFESGATTWKQLFGNLFVTGLWGQQYYHMNWESLLHQGLPAETLFPTQGLVGYYRFEQSAEDGSGFDNDGTAKAGFSYSTDAMEDAGAGQFDGAGGRVVVPNSSSLTLTGDTTIAAWIKIQSASFASRPNILAKSFNNGYRLRFNTNGTLNLLLGNGTANPTQFNGTQAVGLNQWTHVAAVISFNSGVATVRFYVNGVADPTVPTTSLSGIQAGTGVLVLGGRTDQTSATEALQGRLDQVTLYNRALPAAEISQLVQ
jgi:hypothetical protein